MNKESHMQIGTILCGLLKNNHGIYLEEKAFLFGNVLPDYGVKFLIKPHLLKNYRYQLKKRIQNLLRMQKPTAIIGKSCASQLGIICHYYADFFCHVHNGGYSGDVAAHVKYEKALCRHLAGINRAALETAPVHIPYSDIGAEDVLNRFLSAHEAYLKAPASFENDITHTIQTCHEALVLIVHAMTENQPGDYSAAIPMKA